MRKNTCTRLLAGVSAQAGNAAAAAATASSTSATVHCGAWAITWPVEGSWQSIHLVVCDDLNSPLAK